MVKAMRRDTKFLRSNNLMDYSLLVGVEKNSGGDRMGSTSSLTSAVSGYQDVPEESQSRFTFENGSRIVHFSIIDYLQEWNFNKKTERFIKTRMFGKNGRLLSSIEPIAYEKRFNQFME